MSSRQIKIINKKSQQLGFVQWEGGCAEEPPLRMAGFLIGEFKFYLQRSDKIWTLLANFSDADKKINPSDFIFQRVLQKFEDLDSSCLLGMQIKMECLYTIIKYFGPRVIPFSF